MSSEKFETADLGTAAYLRMRGLELKDIDKTEKRYKFIFNVDGDQVKKLQIEFANSESYKFDSNIRILKLMLKDL